MMKAVRILLGIAVVGLLLGVASWAVRDCPVAPYVYENCIWLSVRDQFHLPQSKLLRAAVLEVIGLSLLGGMYLTWRCVFPRSRRT
jgi:hypothetical protein